MLFVRHAQTLVAITSATGLTQIACRHTPADRTRFSSALEKMTLINVNIWLGYKPGHVHSELCAARLWRWKYPESAQTAEWGLKDAGTKQDLSKWRVVNRCCIFARPTTSDHHTQGCTNGRPSIQAQINVVVPQSGTNDNKKKLHHSLKQTTSSCPSLSTERHPHFCSVVSKT